MRKIFFLFFALIVFNSYSLFAQVDKWQQKVNYSIDVKLDVNTNILKGKEVITYWNNSPDSLNKIFFHLFWNAFRPGSMMDQRSIAAGEIILGRDRNGNIIRDWDSRITDRISKLKPEEQGYQNIKLVRVNGVEVIPKIDQTIMEVPLNKKILPHTSAVLEIVFEAQVPIQIRRSGRYNAEGVKYSMSQWYPKIAAYDQRGWHAYQYIAREFYAPFGNFDVNISIDKNYMLAGTGTIINPNEVGYGYGIIKGTPETNSKDIIWRFKANNVHDFVWAADDDYTMIRRKIDRGPLLYFVYKKTNDAYDTRWQNLADTMELVLLFIEKTFGPYRYPNYSFIQAGDGGMEYPMATFIKGPSIGTAIHEWGHNWFQGIIGTNEALYPWMDEGGASYLEDRVQGFLNKDSLWYKNSYKGYYDLVASRLEEPMSTHADRFSTNYAYSLAAYSKGMVFYEQLSYIIGNANMDKFLLQYENLWKYKQPEPHDMVKVAEDVSGLQLQWYKDYWINTTKVIDYAIATVSSSNDSTHVELKNEGSIPMPLDVLVKLKDGQLKMYNIPVSFMYGHKPPENNYYPWSFENEWYWTSATYILKIPYRKEDILSIEIDPSKRMADVNQSNNLWQK